MAHYKSNLRDIEFNLLEVFGPGVFGSKVFEEMDSQTVRYILEEAARLADNLAVSYLDGDRRPPMFDPKTHAVRMPDSIIGAFDDYMADGFWRLDLPTELDGTPGPRMLWWSVSELMLGANAPVMMAALGPPFAKTLYQEGTLEQKAWAELFVEMNWGATMVLTEPDAGSDVGAGRTRAVPQPDGSWHIEGVKRFITNGDHDLASNIIHYVLARPVGVEGAGGPGTKGLSLFVVPKHHFDPESGKLGDRNGVFVTGLEHKMGLKASATCTLEFGQTETPAVGWLVGDVHQGIRQMFLIIQAARMMVGTKAMALLSTGYLNALEYAKTRVQGADMTRMLDKTAPRVTIDHHPDVRRSLLLQKAYTEGLRALVCYAAYWQDQVKLAEVAGDTKATRRATRMSELLLPIVKGVGSERAYELLGSETLQIFGGSGFLQDYPIEQYVRDAKIDTLYEGTTAIQALDLLFRQIFRSPKPAMMLMEKIQEFVDSKVGGPELKDIRAGLADALRVLQDVITEEATWLFAATAGDTEQLYKVGLGSRRLLLAVGDLLIGWLLARQSVVAAEALARGGLSEADVAFYTGKVGVAGFFGREVLTEVAGSLKAVLAASLDDMRLPIEAF